MLRRRSRKHGNFTSLRLFPFPPGLALPSVFSGRFRILFETRESGGLGLKAILNSTRSNNCPERSRRRFNTYRCGVMPIVARKHPQTMAPAIADFCRQFWNCQVGVRTAFNQVLDATRLPLREDSCTGTIHDTTTGSAADRIKRGIGM
jgi:hypothetical protein